MGHRLGIFTLLMLGGLVTSPLRAAEARDTLMVTLVVRSSCQIDRPEMNQGPQVDCHHGAPYRVQAKPVDEVPAEERAQWARLAPASSVAGVWEVTF